MRDKTMDEAKCVFQDSGVQTVTSCQFLGGVIGDLPGRIQYVNMKVDEWERYVRLLAFVTYDLPQEAYIALSKSLQKMNEWAFLQRVTRDCGHLFCSIKIALSSILIFVLLRHDISIRDCSLFLFLFVSVA